MPSPLQKLGAYARLLRLSNGPTAVADVWMGYAVVSGGLSPTPQLALLTGASLCLYHGGMALNDVRDAEQDAIDNRGRPIAAGLITQGVAKRVAQGMLLLGLCFAILSGALVGSYNAMNLALLLVVAIVAYNSHLKRTLAGPPLMGACRALNVMLGMSVAPQLGVAQASRIVPGVFLYVDGLTLFARDESRRRSRWPLVAGFMVSWLGIGWLMSSPWLLEGDKPHTAVSAWVLLWVVAALFATRGMVAAILQPTPKNIGRGVGIAIQGLVVIDATLATLYAGPVAGLAILAMLPVTMLLAQWIPQT